MKAINTTNAAQRKGGEETEKAPPKERLYDLYEKRSAYTAKLLRSFWANWCILSLTRTKAFFFVSVTTRVFSFFAGQD